jgi:UDP-3-O-[3-hydroxymyristoyl] glucosamine N-acyltransferase
MARYSLREIAEHVGGRVAGNADVEVAGIASIASARAGDLVFAEDKKMLEEALASRATAVISANEEGGAAKPLLVHAAPKLAFARAAAMLAEAANEQIGVHPSAVVHSSAKLGLGVAVGANAVIGRNVTIGARTRIGAGVVIGDNVSLGAECVLHPRVTVYAHTNIGERLIAHAGAVLGSDGFGFVRDPQSGRYEKFPQVGRLEVGDDVEIGANATIDRGALDASVIGRGVKIDNLVHVAHNVRIAENVVIAAQTGISGSSIIEKDAVIAGQVGIADHVTIGEGAIMGAQSGVPSNKVIRGKGILFWGTPARPISQYLKELAVLARIAKKQ